MNNFLFTWLLGVTVLQASEVPVIKADSLRKMSLSEVPEEVLIEYLRRQQAGTEKQIRGFILEKLPNNWEASGGGELSLSDAHSKAGVKSIRWDWNKGDVLRIKNIKDLSSLSSERALKISIYQEKSLGNEATIDIIYRRDTVRRAKESMVAKRRYWMNYANWYTFVPVECELTPVSELAEGELKPEADEIFIRAPRNIESGTFYLDRLLVGTTKKGSSFNRPATNLPDEVKNGIPSEPFDPTAYIPDDNGGGTLYFGKYAKKDPLPPSLNEIEQEYINSLRGKPVELDFVRTMPEKQASKVSDFVRETLVQNEDGSYVYPSHMNLILAGVDDPLLFPGDYINGGYKARTYKWLGPGYWVRAQLIDDIKLWQRYPNSKELETKVKATLDWMQYHGIEDGKNSGENWHRSYLNRDIPELAKAIPILKASGSKDDEAYIDYLVGIIRWGTTYNSYLFSKIPGATREVGITATQAFEVSKTDPDDRALYRDLEMIRKRWNRTIAISDYGAMSMIKPDYTFFHHGHLIGYWGGNYPGYAKMGLKFLDTPIENEQEDLQTYTNLAEHSIRFLYAFPTIRDINPWLTNSFGALEAVKTRVTGFKDVTPRHTFFDEFYGMDWSKVPAAKKYVSSVLFDFAYEPENLVELQDRYPKTRGVEIPKHFHLDLNWSAASVFTTGMTRVHARSSNSMAGSVPEVEREIYNLGVRSLGALFIHDSSFSTWKNAHLGGNADGYDWSRTSGVTMPKLTMKEVKSLGVTGIGGGSRVQLDDNGRALDYGGAVTFGESEDELGSIGNLAIYLHPKMYGMDKLSKLTGAYSGQKSYHFFGDQVIALGSDLKTVGGTQSRRMETTLFQNALADGNWKNRDLRRWNISSPLVQVDGKVYDAKGAKAESTLATGSSILSPYGHAWLIPAGQKGALKIQWKDQHNEVSRLGVREGEFVTAWIDHGDSADSTDFVYSILLNNDGKSLEEFQQYMRENKQQPRYEVLQNDAVAHAVYSPEDGAYSYIFFTPRKETKLPHVQSTDRRLNVIAKQAGNQLKLSIADPTILVSRSDKMKQSPAREVKLTLAHKGCKLVSARSGLPQANPKLNASINGLDKNILTYTTRNGVTDNFVIQIPKSTK